jgi:hypothetical protein
MENIYNAFFPRDHDVIVAEVDQINGGNDQFCEQFGLDCEFCHDSNLENRITEIIMANDRLNLQIALFDIEKEIKKEHERYVNEIVLESFQLGHF